MDRDPASPDSPHDGNGDSAANDGHDLQQLLAIARNPPPGTSVYSPEAMVSNAVNPRSCVTCRRRKVRCDKHMPCSNCRRAKIPCIFPAPGRAPRRPRPRDPNAPPKPGSTERELELMKRLHKLEGIVEELSGQIEVEAGRHSAAASPEAMAGNEGDGSPRPSGSNYSSSPGPTGAPRLPAGPNPTHRNTGKPPDVSKQFGRLVLNEKGVSRYVSSGFWSKINDELDQLRRETQKLTDDESDESDFEATPDSAILQDNGLPSNHHAFILGYRSADVDLRPLHPLPSQIPFMWQTYQENVDPLVKILHVPTTEKLVREARNDLDSLTAPTEALLFSIYYAAITSMGDEEVKKNFGSEKSFLLSQYRFALEQGLAKANFITSADLTTIQAFLLFLMLVRRHDDTRFSWTLTGLIMRMGQSIGLHRDGTNFANLTPFEIEMRRRVFWQMCMLDLRSAEDQGSDLNVIDRTFDTQLPLNINDVDISPESTEMPEPRVGPTDMTFALIRYEICSLARRLHAASSAMANVCPSEEARSMEEREAMLAETYNRVEHTYLKDANTGENPIYWVAANIARVIMAKMTLVIYQPLLFPGPSQDVLGPITRERLFRAAIEIFEYNHLLNTDARSKPWRWLFRTYTKWQAVAYVLSEVARRPWSATVERGWTALNSEFSSATPKPADLQKMADNSVWIPFKKLYARAKKHREAEIARLRANPEAALQLDYDERTKSVPSATFGNLPGAIKSAIAHDRWRKLVHAPPLRPETMLPKMTIRPDPSPDQAPESTIAPTPSAVPQSTANDHLMDFVGEAMSNPHVVPHDFIPAMWNISDNLHNPGHLDMYGLNVPGGMLDIGGNTMTPGAVPPLASALRSKPSPGASGYSAHSEASPGGTPGDDNPPPWLWSPGPVSTVEATDYSTMQSDDYDMNMDEGFNWQGFQEDLSKFEMATGGGRGGAWGSGF
ncbi:hypothetical protein GQ53DRAFT_780281 [Thozetella sp. PMI_491]|nr:hypothetical protein GQ53DRAFT_780281 [Thozetella sp. PMI_491]